MKPTPAYSTYIRGDKQISHHWLQSACNGCTYLEHHVSGVVLQVGERLVSLSVTPTSLAVENVTVLLWLGTEMWSR